MPRAKATRGANPFSISSNQRGKAMKAIPQIIIITLIISIIPYTTQETQALPDIVNGISTAVGPNMPHYVDPTNWTLSTTITGNCIPCYTDQNSSTSGSFTSNNQAATSCRTGTNGKQTVKWGEPHVISTWELMAADVSSASTSIVCARLVPLDSSGTEIAISCVLTGWCKATCGTVDKWGNFTDTTAYGVNIYSLQSTGGCSPACNFNLSIKELRVFGLNDSAFPLRYALLNTFWHPSAAFGPQATTVTGFTSDVVSGQAGWYMAYVMAPYNVTTGYPEPMTIAGSGSDSITTLGFSVAKVSGINAGTCVFQALRIHFTGAVNAAVFQPTNPTRAVFNTETVCQIVLAGETYDAAESITADLTGWGSTPLSVIGFLYNEDSTPFHPIFDTDLRTDNSFLKRNAVTISATQADTSGAYGTQFTTTTLEHRFAGNGLYLILGQTNPGFYGSYLGRLINVNGQPAQPLEAASTDTNFVWTLYEIDDQAARNSLGQTVNSTIMEGSSRPYNQESYAMTVSTGWDPNLPIYYGKLLTSYSGIHAGIMCPSDGHLCAASSFNTLKIPQNQTNTITFHVIDINGTGIPNVRILNQNTSTSLFTNNAGDATLTNTFATSNFSFSLPGYQTLCAYFYYFPAGSQTGFDSQTGCNFIKAANAQFTVTMLSDNQANQAPTSGTVSFSGQYPTLTFQVNLCGDTALGPSCNNDLGPLQNVLITYQGIIIAIAYTNSLGQTYLVNFNPQNTGILTISLSKPGYVNNGYSFSIPSLQGNTFKMYMLIGSVVCQPPSQNVPVPSQATFNVTLQTSESAFWSVLRAQPVGLALQTPPGLSKLNGAIGTTFTLSYPPGRISTSIGSNGGDVGSYLLEITNQTQVVIASCPFIIYSGTGNAPQQIIVDSTINQTVQAQLLGSQEFQNIGKEQAVTQAQTASIVQIGIDWAYAKGLFWPHMYEVWAVSAAIAIYAIPKQRRD